MQRVKVFNSRHARRLVADFDVMRERMIELGEQEFAELFR